MAQAMPCSMCEEEASVLLVTALGNGDTDSIGARCLPLWAMGMVNAFVPEGQEPLEYVAELLGPAQATQSPTGDPENPPTGDLGPSGPAPAPTVAAKAPRKRAAKAVAKAG